MKKALKEISGKPKFSYLVWAFIQEMIKVRHYGADKYGDAWDWQHGLPYSEYYDAALRHINTWFHEKETCADDSGLHHLAHASISLMFLYFYEMILKRPDLDDRATPIKIKVEQPKKRFRLLHKLLAWLLPPWRA